MVALYQTQLYNFEIQNAPASKPSTLLSWETDTDLDSPMPDEDKNFRGSLVLDSKIW